MPSRGLRLAIALVLGLVAMAPPLRYLRILGFVGTRSEASSMVRAETRPHHRLALRAIRPIAVPREAPRVEQGPGGTAIRCPPARPVWSARVVAIAESPPPESPRSLILSRRLRC